MDTLSEIRNPFPYNFAIVIGINDYDNGIPPLSTARFDAEKLETVLQEKYDYEVKSFFDKEATSDNIWYYLKQELPEKIKKPEKVRLLFYFAGHGSPPEGEEGEAGYLLPQEAKIGEQDQWLSMKAIYDALIELNCHHLLIILDCCYAGAFRFGTRDIGVMPDDISKERYQRYIDYKAGQVIVSTAHNKEAIDIIRDNRGMSENSVHSPFAELLFKALEAGDADYTNDGITTVTELNLYLYEKLLERTKDQKHPQVSRSWFLPFLDQGEFFFQTGDFDPDQLPDAIALNQNNNPYRGLEPFEEAHCRFFFGRTDKIKKLEKRLNYPTPENVFILSFLIKHQLNQLALTYLTQYPTDQPLTVVLGISGSGKSSLVKAGLIPKLRENNNKWRILEPIAPGLTIFKDLAKAVLPLTLQSSDPDLSFLEKLGTILRQARKRDKYNEEIKELFAQWRITSPEDKLLLIIKDFDILNNLCEDEEQRQSLETLRIIGLNSSSLVLDHFDEIEAFCNDSEREKLKQFTKKCRQEIKRLSEQWQQNGEQFGEFIVQQSPKDKQVKILLVIDQFEHCINQCTNEQRKQFLNALQAALEHCPQQLRLVLTLRADFQHYFENSKQLKDYWKNASFPVKQMERDQLREVIEQPALAQVLYFETNDKGKSLVDELLDDIGETPGALPLLSFTLSELYFKYVQKQRDDRTLTWEDYHELGGVTQSLTRRATEEYNNLAQDVDPSEANARQTMLRWVMLRMVNLEGGEKAKRRVLDAELEYGDKETNERKELVIKRFVDARLLVKGTNLEGDSYVEPVHDVLIREWDKITSWLSTTKEDVNGVQQQSTDKPEKKQGFRFSLPFIGRKKKSGKEQERFNLNLQRDLTDAAFKHKEASEKQSQKVFGLLWDDDPRLPLGQQVLNSDDNWLDAVETDFVKDSEDRKTFKTRRNWSIAIAVIVGLSGLTITALYQAQVSSLREKAASVTSILVNEEPINGLVLAITTIEQNRFWLPWNIINPVQSSLQNALNQAKESQRFTIKGQDIKAAAFSPDGKLIATGDGFTPVGQPGAEQINGTVWLRDMQGRSISQPITGIKGRVDYITFSSDSKYIAVWDAESIKVWDLQGKLRKTQPKPFEIGPDTLIVVEIDNNKIYLKRSWLDDDLKASSRDDQYLATIEGNNNERITVWNNLNQENYDDTEALISFKGCQRSIMAISFSHDNHSIIGVCSDNTIRIWKWIDDSFLEQSEYGTSVGAMAFIPDGENIIISDSDDNSGYQSVNIFNLTKKKNIKFFKTELNQINSIAVSRNGQNIIFSDGSKIQLINIDNGNEIKDAFEGHEHIIESLAFSPDNKYIISSSFDTTIRLWNLKGENKKTIKLAEEGLSAKEPFKIEGEIWSVKSVIFSPDNKYIIAGISTDEHNMNGVIQLLDINGNPIHKPFGNDWRFALSSDKKYIAVADVNNTIQLWDMNGNQVGSPFQGHEDPIQSLAFSPDSRFIASASYDNTIKIWDIQGNLIRTFISNRTYIKSIKFSFDGRYIATTSYDKPLQLWPGNWQSMLISACNRLKHHPVLSDPKTETAKNALDTCKKYVWQKLDNEYDK